MPIPFTLANTLPQVATTSPVVGAVVPTYSILIGGVYYNIQKATLNIQNAIGHVGTGSVTVTSPLGTSWQYGAQALILNETGAQVYGGYVARDHAYRDPGARQGDQGLLLHDLTLMDNTYRASKRVPLNQYNNVTCGAIINDLYGAYLAAEGVIITASSVATGPTIIQAIWGGSKTIAGVLTWLAQVAGYWWNIDVDGVLWFQPYGGIAAPFNIDGTNIDAMQNVTVDYGNDMLVNKQYVKGSVGQKGSVSSPLVETFKGDGARRTFTLGYQLNTLISATLNAIDITNTFGDKGSSGASYYGLVGDANITQDPSQTVLTSSDSLVITYIGQFPILSMAQNSTAIAAQAARERTGTGIIEAVYSDNKVRNLPAAFQIASSRLTHYGADLVGISYYTKTPGLQPGQLQLISLSDFGLATLPGLISTVSVTDQLDGQTIWFQVSAVGAVGATVWALEAAQWPTFWQNLMAQDFDPSDLTDAQDTALALFASSVATRTPTVAVTQTKAFCALFSNATVFSNSTTFC